MAITDLAELLSTMDPILYPEPYAFVVRDGVLPFRPFATVAEAEGMTVVAPFVLLNEGVQWARISLTVNSDLTAVGLTAAFATKLAQEGISCNVIAGVHHDHVFVQWERRHDAMAALRGLAGA